MDCDKEELEATRNRGKDINKSIVIVKRLRDETKDALKCIYITDNKQWKEEAEALDHVLEYIQELEKQSKATEELETHKKIAEKLADKLVEIEDGCKHIPTEICNEYSNGRCKQCIINWARNEVKK